jgi:hypothetical protein
MNAPLAAPPTRSQIERRRRLAEALQYEGTSTAPVGHWTGALARALQGGLGGYQARKADEMDTSRGKALADALTRGGDPSSLETAGITMDAPELIDIAGGRRADARDERNFAYRQSRDATQDNQWAQGHQLDQQALNLRGQPNLPSGYRTSVDGNLEAIPGGPADPNKPMPARAYRPTTDQANAAGFYDRMKASNQVLSDPNVTQAAMSFGQGLMNMAPMGLGNYMTSPEYQKYDQASRDFVNAILRKESGAAIPESEFENARIQYFPQPGDTPEKIAQKQKNREIVINAMHRTAGPALAQEAAQPGQVEPNSMEFGEVGQIPEGAVVEDEQGMRYRKENGTLVPVQ